MHLNDLINKELGRYRIEALVGRGGMAAVYRAFDTRLHRHVALKVLYPQYLADDDIVERFRREAVTAAQLDHPHIAPIFDVGDADGLLYLTMKLLPGPSLAALLQREQRFAPERVVMLAHEIASALDEAHLRGIIHRDIKPGNVLFDARGRAVLTDFGIAKSLDAPSLTESSVIVGTPDYIAPEQIDSRLAPDGKLDYRADLYSLGAMLYRALTGRRPFDGSSQAVLIAHLRDNPAPPSSILPELPPAVDAVFAKAMAKQPTERYSSASELAQALAESFGDKTEVGVVFPPTAIRSEPHAHPTTQLGPHSEVQAAAPVAVLPPVPEPTPARRRSARVPLTWLVTLLLLVGVGATWMRFTQPDQTVVAAAPATQAPTNTTTATATATRTLTATSTTAPSATSTTAPSATAEPSATATNTPPTSTATTHVVVARQPTAPPKVKVAMPRPSATAKPTPRPATPIPTPQPTAKPTDPPPPHPTTTDVAAPCRTVLTGGFGHLWRNNASVRNALDCPTEAERAGYSVEQIFQGGRMYYRDDTREFWVFSSDTGLWRRYVDVYESDPEPTEDAPGGLITPVRGFGRLWQKYPPVRAALGWATTPEIGFNNGVAQRFEGGSMLYVPAVLGHRELIYVLYNNSRFDILPDNYPGP